MRKTLALCLLAFAPALHAAVINIEAGQGLSEAANNATPGTTIVVGPGLYTNQFNLLRNGVNWEFRRGAVISNFCHNGTKLGAMFDNGPIFNSGLAITSSVSGSGTFISRMDNTDGTVTSPVLTVSNSQSVIRFQCDRIALGDLDTRAAGVCILNCKDCRIDVDVIDAGFQPGDALVSANQSQCIGVYWELGSIWFRGRSIYGDMGPAIWGTGTAAGDLYADLQNTVVTNYVALYHTASHANNKLWVRAAEIIGNEGGASLGRAIDCEGGKMNVQAQRLAGVHGNSAIPIIAQTGGQLWVNADRVTCTNQSSWMLQSGGMSWLRCANYEDAGVGVAVGRLYGFKISGGTNTLLGGDAVLNWGAAYWSAGGQAILDGIRLNTFGGLASTNNGLYITGGTPVCKNVVMVPGSLFSVSNASAGDLRVYGTGGLLHKSNITATITIRGGTAVADATWADR